MWVIPFSMHYRTLFLDAMKQYVHLLMAADRLIDTVSICKKASEIDPYDEDIHTLLITAYARQGNTAVALAHYERTTEMLYRNLSVQPSDKLRGVYLELMRGHRALETDLGAIRRQLREPDDETGAFVCDYGFFREAYRLEARRAARAGTCVHISLITVSTKTGEVPPLDLLNQTMDALLDVLKSSLRKGDIISRYSGAQFVVLLPTANFEDGDLVLQRILGAFRAQYPRNPLKITHKLQQLDCVP